MPRALTFGLFLAGLALLTACSSGARDPFVGEPINTDIQQVRLGNSIVDFNGLNLLYLEGAGRVRIDVNQAVNIDEVRQSLAINLNVRGEDGDERNYTGLDVERFGRLELVDRELGIVDWIPDQGSLAGLSPGVRYRLLISSFFMRVNNKPADGIGLTSEEFDLIPLSIADGSFDTRLESDGLINRISLGNVAVDRRDSVRTLVALHTTDIVTIDLATNISPATFEPGLQYELIIDNLTSGESFSFNIDDLLANGEFSFPDANNGRIVWTKTTPGGLAAFFSTSVGSSITVSHVGDELQLRIDRVSGLRANGDRLTLRDRAFRILHTYS